ncbi:MAG: hypothetical protein KYX64_07235 [Sphingopyxis sp.]|nr:hypothetical protein [Sphingopyxis sp.]
MTTERHDAARPPHWHWRRWLWVAAAILLAWQIYAGGGEATARIAAALGATALLVALGFAVQYVEQRTERPRRTYLRWAYAAAVLAIVLVAMPLAIGAGFIVGVMLWTGFSAAGLAWAISYERTEPL